MRTRRRQKVEVLRGTVQGIGNAEIISGTEQPNFLKAQIVTGRYPHEWVDVMQPGGRMTVRVSAIVALWVEEQRV